MMSFASALGLLRSLVVYYGQPWRTRALRRFYRQVIVPGSLVFDIGAHVGHRSRALAAAGARVIAVEPQPVFAAFMQRFVAGSRIQVLPLALGAASGATRQLHVSSRHPTVSTLDAQWQRRVGAHAAFAHVDWDQQVTVDMTTLDRLIARHGRPAFCKIDVEGMEADILAGLSEPLDMIAIEYIPQTVDVALACVDRLSQLGDYRFNHVRGESHRLARRQWITADECRQWLGDLAPSARPGDLYARRETAR